MDGWCDCSYLQGDVQGLDQFYLIYYTMEKLLQLLNEYNCEKLWYVDKWEIKNNKFILDYKIWIYAFRTHLYIISKEYWFIQWLRSHDRIRDFGPLEQLVNGYWRFQEYESRLMLLSIQDDPIGFLISILK